jgi:hypothetical protein
MGRETEDAAERRRLGGSRPARAGLTQSSAGLGVRVSVGGPATHSPRRDGRSLVSPSQELVESKLHPPRARPGIVPRTALVERLLESPAPVVCVVAPPGYGKTTVLAQWAERKGQVGWVGVDQRDNDPTVLLTDIAATLDRVEPLDPETIRSLASPGAAVAAWRLGVGLLVFAGVVTWQIRAVLRSRYPGLRAIEALAAAIPLFLLVFAVAYLRMADADAGAFSEPLSRTDALYFTITVFSTVGFGDITPKTDLARVATMVQMLGDLLVVGLVLHLMVGAVKAGLQRRAAASPSVSDSSPQGPAGPPAKP